MTQDWELKRLDEICEFGNGLWTGKKPPFQKVGVIRNTNFTKDGKLDDSNIVYLDVEQSQYAKRKLQYGDIILEKSGGGPKQPVGRVIIFDKGKGDFSFSNFTSVIRVINPNMVDFNYLHRFLFLSYISGATEKMQSHSTGIRNLRFDDYKAIQIPIPSLSEQKRIVAVLDEIFAAIAKAETNAEQNIKNAKELLESYSQGVFENRAEGWEIKRLDDLCQIELGKTPYRGDKSFWDTEKETNNVWLSIADMLKTEGDVVLDSKEYITDKAVRVSRLVKAGTLLLSFKLTLGRLAFAGKDLYTNEAIAALTIKNERLINKHFLYQFLSMFDWDAATEGDIKLKGRTLNKAKLKKLEVHFPKSITEQQRIVQKLNAMSTETKKLEAVYQQKINDLEELKKSVLQKAFNGELKTSKEVVVL